jgi:hypothetical protein
LIVGDIFREIDEELRQDKFERLWREYGRYVIAGAVVIVLAVAGFSGWQQYRESQRLEAGARFAAAKASEQDGKTEDAAALFAALGRESGTSYGTLARFHEAALIAKKGDGEGAAALYDTLAADTGVDAELRDLATILAASIRANGASPDSAAIEAKLRPLIDSGGTWRHSALEILGTLAHRKGDLAEAKETFKKIVDDFQAPQGLRARASQMLAIMGN